MKVLTIDPNNSIATNLLALILSESKDPADLERALGYAQRNAALYRQQHAGQHHAGLGAVPDGPRERGQADPGRAASRTPAPTRRT